MLSKAACGATDSNQRRKSHYRLSTSFAAASEIGGEVAAACYELLDDAISRFDEVIYFCTYLTWHTAYAHILQTYTRQHSSSPRFWRHCDYLAVRDLLFLYEQSSVCCEHIRKLALRHSVLCIALCYMAHFAPVR